MKLKLPLEAKIILLLAATTFPLQAFPMFGEAAENHTAAAAAAKVEQAEQTEEAGRRRSDPTRETSDADFQQRGDNPSIAEESPAENNPEVSSPSPMPQAVPGASAAQPPAMNSAATGLTLHYRLDSDGWKVQDPHTEAWSPTQQFERKTEVSNPLERASEALRAFSKHYNRADSINKTKATYEKELRNEKLKPSSREGDYRIFALEHLIPVLEKAIIYQNAMVRKLAEAMLLTNSTNLAARAPILLTSIMKINDSPNKLEKVAYRINLAYDHLLSSQMASTPLVVYARNTFGVNAVPPDLLYACLLSNSVLEDHRNVIRQLSTYSELLCLPFEITTASHDSPINKQLLTYRKAVAIAANASNFVWEHIKTNHPVVVGQFCLLRGDDVRNRLAAESHQSKAHAQAATLFNQALPFLQETFAALQANNATRLNHASDVSIAFCHAVVEALQPEQNQEVINSFTHSAELHQQAAASHLTDPERSACLRRAAYALSSLAAEQQELQPNKPLMTLLARFAELAKQAVAAPQAPAFLSKRLLLLSAARSFSTAIQEARKEIPKEDLIHHLTRAAESYEKAAAKTERNDLIESYLYMMQAASLSQIVDEAQQEAPNEQVISLYNRAAELSEKAAAALAENHRPGPRAASLKEAAFAFENAAKEAKKIPPNQALITFLTGLADRYCNIELSLQSDNSEIQAPLYQATVYLSKIVNESQQETPNQKLIDLYNQAAGCYEKAAAACIDGAIDPQDIARKNYYLNAASAFDAAVVESQKARPNEDTMNFYERAATNYKKAALALETEGDSDKAYYLDKAAICLFNAAQESQQARPNAQRIAQLLRAAREYESLAQSLLPCCTIS